MGNQGMKNWKLIALFAVSLMLIAGLLSYTAIARDGSGTASVTWTGHHQQLVLVLVLMASISAALTRFMSIYFYVIVGLGGLATLPAPASCR